MSLFIECLKMYATLKIVMGNGFSTCEILFGVLLLPLDEETCLTTLHRFWNSIFFQYSKLLELIINNISQN